MIYILIAYFAIILTIGFWTKSKKNTKDFVYAGRKLTAIPLAFTLITTWYGAISSVGQEISYNGISTWLYFGLTYYIAAFIYSEFISSKIIDKNISSISDAILKHMGKKAALISIPVVLLYISPAPYLIMLGNIINTTMFKSTNFTISVLIGVIISTLYCFKGGFKAIINTDRYQFYFMFSGFFLMVLYIVLNYDYGFVKLKEIYNTDPDLFAIPGNQGWGYIIAWGFLAILTFVDPNFHQRTFSSKNKAEIKNAIRISIFCWFIFDIITLFCGLYTIGLASHTPYISLALDVFKNYPLLYGIFIISILSIVMSTIDSFTFVSAITIGKDIKKILNKDFTQKDINWGILFTITLSLIIIQFFDNSRIIQIWFTFGSYMVSGLLVPFMCILFNIKIRCPIILILLPLILTLVWDIMQISWIISMYPGLFLSILLGLLLKIRN
ncbi:MAG: hypothetical protein CMG00_05185 [Candidatus Marinimicrobia bacterium]|nr:hypothetical protein [Candidatus Neomarinimicrobiota bacterium]